MARARQLSHVRRRGVLAKGSDLLGATASTGASFAGEARGGRQSAVPIDVGDEPVAAPGQRLDETRLHRRIAQRLAKPPHRGVQAALEVDEGVVGPELMAEAVAA